MPGFDRLPNYPNLQPQIRHLAPPALEDSPSGEFQFATPAALEKTS
ncbi:hypothetical protein RR11_3224 [Ruegeria sp. R11]|nr:hypothetical protein RR11_3224 [Ruegeria sp. R11]